MNIETLWVKQLAYQIEADLKQEGLLPYTKAALQALTTPFAAMHDTGKHAIKLVTQIPKGLKHGSPKGYSLEKEACRVMRVITLLTLAVTSLLTTPFAIFYPRIVTWEVELLFRGQLSATATLPQEPPIQLIAPEVPSQLRRSKIRWLSVAVGSLAALAVAAYVLRLKTPKPPSPTIQPPQPPPIQTPSPIQTPKPTAIPFKPFSIQDTPFAYPVCRPADKPKAETIIKPPISQPTIRTLSQEDLDFQRRLETGEPEPWLDLEILVDDAKSYYEGLSRRINKIVTPLLCLSNPSVLNALFQVGFAGWMGQRKGLPWYSAAFASVVSQTLKAPMSYLFPAMTLQNEIRLTAITTLTGCYAAYRIKWHKAKSFSFTQFTTALLLPAATSVAPLRGWTYTGIALSAMIQQHFSSKCDEIFYKKEALLNELGSLLLESKESEAAAKRQKIKELESQEDHLKTLAQWNLLN